MNDSSRKKPGDTRTIAIRGAREHNSARRRLRISLVPESLHGKNLRTELGPHRWRKLRKSMLPSILNCQICGNHVDETSDINAHEEWLYDTQNKRRVAKLTRISFLCKKCHGCQHFLNTLRLLEEGYLTLDQVDDTIRHYCRVNRVSRHVFDLDLKKAKMQLKRRSKLKWKIDYGQFANFIAEKMAYVNRPPTKLRLSPATDSEPPEPSHFVRRGPKPIFGRTLTSAERSKRARALKKQRDQDWADLREMNSVPSVLSRSSMGRESHD